LFKRVSGLLWRDDYSRLAASSGNDDLSGLFASAANAGAVTLTRGVHKLDLPATTPIQPRRLTSPRTGRITPKNSEVDRPDNLNAGADLAAWASGSAS
jgi:hypothetical protein